MKKKIIGLLMLALTLPFIFIQAQTDAIVGNGPSISLMEGMRGPLHRTGNPNSNNRYLFIRHFALYPQTKLC